MDHLKNADAAFHAIRRHDRALDRDAAVEILAAGEYGVLSTWGEDGWPYGVPLSYVLDGERLYFHCAVAGHKLDNLRFCERACFTVVGKTRVLPELFSTAYQSAVAFGTVRVVEDAAEKKRGLLLLAEKYSNQSPDRAERYAESAFERVCVCCMEIAHVSGKARPE